MAPTLSSTSSDNVITAASDPLFQLRAARKRYGRKLVLDVDTFPIYDGDAIELVGGNASGKSTLSRVLAGYTRLSEGTVDRAPDAAKAKIGFLPQSGGFYPDLTLLENVITIARMFGRIGPIEAHGERIFFDLGLMEYLGERVGNLSGGLQRLTALAALYAARPFGLILDEPFAGLDDDRTASLRTVLGTNRYGMRFTMVTGHAVAGLFPEGHLVKIENGRIAPLTTDSDGVAR